MATVQGGKFPISIAGLTCTATESVGDPVYFSGVDTVSQASAASIATARVCGFIESKESATTCTIKTGGLIAKAGLVANRQYFLGAVAGQITETPPTASGSVVVKVGLSKSTDSLLIGISPERVIRA